MSPPRVQLSCPELLAPHRLANRASAPLVPESFSRDAPLAPPASNYCTGVINVNIHYMLLLDGTGNFNETDDGAAYTPWNQPGVNVPADTTNNGYARARALVTDMNIQAANNPLNGYPAGTTNPSKGYSYALNGVYFHRVSPSEYESIKNDNTNIYSTAPFDNYGINKASEMNLILMGNYTNGSCCDLGGVACGLGYNPATPGSYWAKLFNSHELYRWRQENRGNTLQLSGGPYTIPQDSQYSTANALGHEIGHIIGLYHTFNGANGCADAAVPNRGDSGNNLMDYINGTALTPCQLGVVNYNLFNPGNPTSSYHNYLSTSLCGEVPPRAFFVLPTCQYTGNVQLDSRGTFMADQMMVRVYAYDAAAPNGQGTLLVTYSRPVSQGGRWNLANLCAFAAGSSYVVALTAQRTSGTRVPKPFRSTRLALPLVMSSSSIPPATNRHLALSYS